MKQQDFESKYNILWDALEQAFETSKIHDLADFPQNYRQICHHLAIAKHRRYSTYLIDRLNQLALKCHYHLYRHNPRFNHQWLKFIAFEFPHTLRENARYIWTSIALFLIPGLLMFLLCLLNGEMIYSIMPAEHIRELENMYDPAARVLGRARESETDLMMFGYYIKNNIGISFQTFAGGMLFGLGSVFFMFYNGLVIGATAGHITNLNYIDTFYPFVVGHGAFELIAIIFSGAAGLRIGFSLIAPGPCSRINALQISSRSAIKIIYGSTIMLLIAAFLEAFWSSNTDIPIIIKYSVGAIFWLTLILYFLTAGRPKKIES